MEAAGWLGGWVEMAGWRRLVGGGRTVADRPRHATDQPTHDRLTTAIISADSRPSHCHTTANAHERMHTHTLTHPYTHTCTRTHARASTGGR